MLCFSRGLESCVFKVESCFLFWNDSKESLRSVTYLAEEYIDQILLVFNGQLGKVPFPPGHLFPSKVPGSYILEMEEYSSIGHAFPCRAR
jgi:hypothetical protein